MSDRSLARLARAEKAAADARVQLGETLSSFQDKLSPASIMGEVGRVVREKRSEMSQQLMGNVLSRPVLTTVLLGGLGWVLRKQPGLSMLLKLFLRGSATTRPPVHSIGSRPQRPRRRTRPTPAAVTSEETA